jgi:hypothetical protein
MITCELSKFLLSFMCRFSFLFLSKPISRFLFMCCWRPCFVLQSHSPPFVDSLVSRRAASVLSFQSPVESEAGHFLPCPSPTVVHFVRGWIPPLRTFSRQHYSFNSAGSWLSLLVKVNNNFLRPTKTCLKEGRSGRGGVGISWRGWTVQGTLTNV